MSKDKESSRPSYRESPNEKFSSYVSMAIGAGFVIWLIFGMSDSESSSNPYQNSSSSAAEECTSDCSGHSAGYDYAEENDITDTDYSNGNSESFNEGVREYAEQN